METSGKIPGKNPFKVPEKYFEEVNRKILASTSEKNVSGLSLYNRIKPFLAAAAAIAVLVTAAYFSSKFFSPAEKESDLSALSIPDNTELLINELDIITLENDTTLTGMFTESTDLNSSEIIKYLIQEDVDISEIYERL